MRQVVLLLTLGFVSLYTGLQAQQQLNIQLNGPIPDTFLLQKAGSSWYFNGQAQGESPVLVNTVLPSANGGQGNATMGIVAGTGNHAVTIKNIYPGPAFGGGLRRGDQIMEVNGISTNKPEDLERIISGYAPGTLVTVKFARRNKRFFTDFYLGPKDRELNKLRTGVSSRSSAPVISDSQPQIGMSLKESGTGPGLHVSAVTKGGRAEKAGIRAGDRILSINSHELKTLDDINNDLWKSKEWNINLLRDGNTVQTKIKF